jgi:hypothetical protein
VRRWPHPARVEILDRVVHAERQRKDEAAPAVDERVAFEEQPVVLVASEPLEVGSSVAREPHAPIALVVVGGPVHVIADAPDVHTELAARPDCVCCSRRDFILCAGRNRPRE